MGDTEIEQAYGSCRALLFPGEEDFGIVPVEAMASGKPVIAFGKGGATETVIEGVSGTLFEKQTIGSFSDAMRRFERMEFDARSIRAHAETFDRKVYSDKMGEFITEKWNAWNTTRR
jgi:glycosyltransferase involved in cell wall biosynthesis